jgi:hypothetical protein
MAAQDHVLRRRVVEPLVLACGERRRRLVHELVHLGVALRVLVGNAEQWPYSCAAVFTASFGSPVS